MAQDVPRQSTYFWWVIIAASFAYSITKQVFFPYNHDNALHLFAAQTILEHGELYKYFLETNPPLYPYLMTVPVKLGQILALSPYGVFLMFVYAIAGWSLWRSHTILTSQGLITSIQNPWILTTMVSLAGVAALDYEFGQRDHIIAFLILPYITLLAPRIVGNVQTGYHWGIWLALALAIAIKPNYILVWIIGEIVVAGRHRSPLLIFSRVNGLVVSFGIFYVVAAYIIEPKYFHTVLPLAMDTYGKFGFPHGNSPVIFGTSLILLSACGLRLAFLMDKQFVPHVLATLVGLAGVYLTWLSQSNFGYQKIPVFILATRLLTIIFMIVAASTWMQSIRIRNLRNTAMILFLAALFIATCPKWLWKEIGSSISSGGKDAISWSSAYPGFHQEIELFNTLSSDKHVFVFTTNVSAVFPAVLYSKALWQHRMYTMWPLPALAARSGGNDSRSATRDIDVTSEIRKWTVTDFRSAPPQLILVDVSPRKSYFSENNQTFDYISFMSESAEFSQFWSEYRELGRVQLSFFEGSVDRCFSVNIRREYTGKVPLESLNIRSTHAGC